MKVGYCRVSTVGQTLEAQLEKLADCEKVFSEKLSGKDRNRPELERALEFVREGDTLVVTKLDRLARSLHDLCKVSDLLQEKGVALKVVDQSIDTSTPAGKLMFHMIGAIAEFERSLINERTAEGREAALAKGVKFGRKEKLSEEQKLQIVEMCKTMKKPEVAKHFGISRALVYQIIKEMQK